MIAQFNIPQVMNIYKDKVNAKLEIAATLVEASAKRNAPADLGALRNSIYHEVDPANLTARVIADTPYAHIQEVGGEIRPDKAGALTVPIHPDAKHKRASDFNDLVLIKTKTGKSLLVRISNKQFDVMFVLVQSVKIPAQPYMRPALYDNKTEIMKLFGAQ